MLATYLTRVLDQKRAAVLIADDGFKTHRRPCRSTRTTF